MIRAGAFSRRPAGIRRVDAVLQGTGTEGLFAGTSTGANLVAALQVGIRLGPTATVVTALCDTGLKYLSAGLYVVDGAIPNTSATARMLSPAS